MLLSEASIRSAGSEEDGVCLFLKGDKYENRVSQNVCSPSYSLHALQLPLVCMQHRDAGTKDGRSER